MRKSNKSAYDAYEEQFEAKIAYMRKIGVSEETIIETRALKMSRSVLKDTIENEKDYQRGQIKAGLRKSHVNSADRIAVQLANEQTRQGSDKQWEALRGYNEGLPKGQKIKKRDIIYRTQRGNEFYNYVNEEYKKAKSSGMSTDEATAYISKTFFGSD